MDYQEKIMYIGLMTIIKILIQMIPEEEFENTIDPHLNKTIRELGMLMDQRIEELKQNELG